MYDNVYQKLPFHAPYPTIGSCPRKGNWNDPGQVSECMDCLKYSTPDMPYFYCDGKCHSAYSLNTGSCAVSSLVATNPQQCSSPCYQTGYPGIHGQNPYRHPYLYQQPRSVSVEEFEGAITPETSDNYFNMLVKAVDDCYSGSTISLCIKDIENLNCKDIKDIIKLNVELSKKDGTYAQKRKHFVDINRKVKTNPKIHENTYNMLTNSLKIMNCIIQQVQDQYQLEEDERVSLINIREAKRKYINHILSQDQVLKESIQNSLFDESKLRAQEKPSKTDDNTKKYLIIAVIVLSILVVLLLVFYRSGTSGDIFSKYRY